jgi:hypothetical protein
MVVNFVISITSLWSKFGLSDCQSYLRRNVVTTITKTLGRLWISALPLVVFFAAPTVANAQTRIGTASSVTPDASGSIGGTLSAGSGVHTNETVKTGSFGKAGLQFSDQSTLSVGPSSQARSTNLCMIQTKVAAARLLKPRGAHSASARVLKTRARLKSRRPMACLARAADAAA